MTKKDMNKLDLDHTKPKIGGDAVTVQPPFSFPCQTELHLPGSKSYSNRAVVLAAMSNQPTTLSGFLFSDDTYWGLECLRDLGFTVSKTMGSNVELLIEPPKAFDLKHITKSVKTLFLGKAGTLARFLPAAVLNLNKTFPNYPISRFLLSADPQLQRRPMTDLFLALKELGGQISYDQWPIELKPSSLSGQTCISGSTSGQFLSGLLLAAVGCKNPVVIKRKDSLVQPDYVRMTIQAIEKFNGHVDFSQDLDEFKIHQTNDLSAEHFEIEPDASTACYFIALAVLHDFNLIVKNLGSDSLQPDLIFVDFLKRMGANISVFKNEIHVHRRGKKTLLGGFSSHFYTHSDQALTAAALALFADAPIEITGIGHIRHHESNRIAALIQNMNALGVHAAEKKDGFVIQPLNKTIPLNPSPLWRTFDDHRFAMSGFLISSVLPGLRIENPNCVSKTAPTFWSIVESLHFNLIFS